MSGSKAIESSTCTWTTSQMLACRAMWTCVSFGLLAFEHWGMKNRLPKLYEHSTYFAEVPKAFSLVLLFNVVASVLTIKYLGMEVTKARIAFTEKAKKDGGDSDPTNFSYPRLYAEGNSECARKFNAIQRGHQAALETYSQFLVMSLIGGMDFPLTVALGGLMWCFGRWNWAKVYAAELDPCKSWRHPFSHGICMGMSIAFVTTFIAAVQLSGLLPVSMSTVRSHLTCTKAVATTIMGTFHAAPDASTHSAT